MKKHMIIYFEFNYVSCTVSAKSIHSGDFY